jgi:hypothetical protein
VSSFSNLMPSVQSGLAPSIIAKARIITSFRNATIGDRRPSSSSPSLTSCLDSYLAASS